MNNDQIICGILNNAKCITNVLTNRTNAVIQSTHNDIVIYEAQVSEKYTYNKTVDIIVPRAGDILIEYIVENGKIINHIDVPINMLSTEYNYERKIRIRSSFGKIKIKFRYILINYNNREWVDCLQNTSVNITDIVQDINGIILCMDDSDNDDYSEYKLNQMSYQN